MDVGADRQRHESGEMVGGGWCNPLDGMNINAVCAECYWSTVFWYIMTHTIATLNKMNGMGGALRMYAFVVIMYHLDEHHYQFVVIMHHIYEASLPFVKQGRFCNSVIQRRLTGPSTNTQCYIAFSYIPSLLLCGLDQG